MPSDFDIAVLGAGIAGSAAAIAAAQNGGRVCIITGPPGATAMFSGAWHGPVHAPVRAALEGIGYRLHADAQPLRLPHPSGQLLHADAAPFSHTPPPADSAPIVVGIAGLPGFDAPILARRWGVAAAETVQLESTPAAGWSPASLATCIDRDPSAIIDAVGTVVEARQASHLIVPAVLGMMHDGAAHAQLEQALGCTVSEALGIPPSLPGWRLQIALQLALRTAGVVVFESKAGRPHVTDGTVQHVELNNGDVVRAHCFVLATGKYASGGIEANGDFREPIFGCPVWIDHLGDRFEQPDSLMLTDPVRTAEQALLRAGVHADAQHRPMDRTGRETHSNVLIAGSIRAGWTSATHGVGHAAEDGWAAGLTALAT